jgi:hypothetical protein
MRAFLVWSGVGLGCLALFLFYWVLIVFVNTLSVAWVKTCAVIAVTLIPVGGLVGAVVGFKFGKRDTTLTLDGFWGAVNTVIPQMNAHAQEMSDIRITSARRMFREDRDSLTVDAGVMPTLITARAQSTQQEEEA